MQNKGQNETQAELVTVTYLIKLCLVTEAHNHGRYEFITF